MPLDQTKQNRNAVALLAVVIVFFVVAAVLSGTAGVVIFAIGGTVLAVGVYLRWRHRF